MNLIDKDALVAEIVRKVFELLIDEDKVKLLLPKISNDAPKIYEGFMSNLSDLYKFVDNEFKDKIVNIVLDNIALDNLIEVKEVDLDEAARKWEDKVYLEKGWQDEYGTPHAPFSEIGNAFREGAKFMIKVQKGE